MISRWVVEGVSAMGSDLFIYLFIYLVGQLVIYSFIYLFIYLIVYLSTLFAVEGNSSYDISKTKKKCIIAICID